MRELKLVLLVVVMAFMLATPSVAAADLLESATNDVSPSPVVDSIVRATPIPLNYYHITGCRVITKPGTYYVTRDLVNVRCPIAIDIRCSNVVIVGNNHLIDGLDGLSTAGIRVGSTSGGTYLSNVQVRNVRLTDWGNGLLVQQTKSVKISNVQSRSNRNYGISIFLGSKPVAISSCTVESNGVGGIDVTDNCQATISSCRVASNNGHGISADTSSVSVSSSTIRSNKKTGIDYARCGGTVSKNKIDANGEYGISERYDSYAHTITGNRITNNKVAGVAGTYSALTIYNNYFLNTVNAGYQSGTLSVTKRAGPNIVGGPYIGGNFWGQPNGKGFSQITPDKNHDGFCDKPYTALGAVDKLPLHTYP